MVTSRIVVPNRYWAFVLVVFVASSSLLFSLNAQAQSDSEAESRARPNIVLVVADDLAPQRTGFMKAGASRNTFTPSLDSLAAQGTVLADLHSPSPVCTPSRFALMTGRYPSRATNDGFLETTQRNGGQTVVRFNTHVEPGDDNLARRLKRAGYSTGAVGKNHFIEVEGHQNLPYDSDLDDPDVQETLKENATQLAEAYRGVGFEDTASLYFGNPDADGIKPLAAHNQDWVTKGALEFIRGHDDEPFFLYMATTLPHGPFEAERSWKADRRITSQGMLEEAPNVQPGPDSIAARLEAAGVDGWNRENVLWLDDAVGAVVEQLEQVGVRENTIIVFVSDHGASAKGSLYPEGTRTVGLISKEGGFPAGGRLEAQVSLVDLLPTVLQWADVEYDGAVFDGTSLVPLLQDEADEVRDAHYFELGYTRAVQQDSLRYVAVRYPEWARELSRAERERRLEENIETLKARGRPIPTTDPGTPFSHLSIVPGGTDAEQISIDSHPAYFEEDQLYNLNADPNAQKNLADDPQYKDDLERLKALLDDYVRQVPGHFGEFGRTSEDETADGSE